MGHIPSGKQLYEESRSGLSEHKLAKKYKTSRAVVHGRIYRYKKNNEENQEKKNDFETDDINKDEVAEEQVTVKLEKNDGTVQCKSRLIKTLDQLLEASETDLVTWEVIRHVINKWDVTNKYGDRFTNWQVKAWLARKEPIDLFPDISPVEIPLSDLAQPRGILNDSDSKDTITRVLFVTDPHFGYDKDVVTQKLKPYHNERVLQITLDILSDNDFDYVIWGGDILDCNEWSTHFIKRPEFRQTTQPAINEAAKWLASFKMAKPKAKHIVLIGNHDDRLENYIISNLSEVYRLVPGDSEDYEPLMSMSNLLGLKRMDIEYIDKYIIGRTKFVHGDIARNGGGMTARAHLENKVSNTVFGHVHRRELVTETKIEYGDVCVNIFAMCPGCMCFTDGRVPGSDYDDNWQNGIGVLEFKNNRCISHQIIMIENDMASYNGKVYSW